MIDNVLIVLLAYLIGAIPTGYLIGKIGYGVDLKTTGSGNVGATNAYRTLGAKAGLLVFFADFFKGMAAVYPGMPDPVLVLACAVFAIIGNDWSVFLKFKSGKGVACGVGAFTLICPYATLASFVVWPQFLPGGNKEPGHHACRPVGLSSPFPNRRSQSWSLSFYPFFLAVIGFSSPRISRLMLSLCFTITINAAATLNT